MNEIHANDSARADDLETEDLAAEEAEEAEGPPPKIPRSTLDTVLNVFILVLLAGVIGLGAWFGYSVYQTRQAERLATPALRLVENMKAQVRENPNDANLRIRLGEALGAVGQYDAAVEQFENALKIEPENTAAYLDLGLVAIEQRDFGAANRFLLRVIELTEGSDFQNVDLLREYALYNLGLISLENGEYEDAVAFFRNALRVKKDASDTYYNLAQAYYGLDEVDAALEQLEIAIMFDPNYAQAHFLWGEILLEQGDEVEASNHFYAAVQAVPDADPPQEALASLGPAEDRIARARSAQQAGELEEALGQVRIARNVAPDNIEATVLHAELLVAVGDPKGAITAYEEALQIAPDEDKPGIEEKIDRLKSESES